MVKTVNGRNSICNASEPDCPWADNSAILTDWRELGEPPIFAYRPWYASALFMWLIWQKTRLYRATFSQPRKTHMKPQPFRINIYNVVPPDDVGPDLVPFGETIRSASGQIPEYRTVNVGDATLRLEHYDQRDQFHLLNFGRLRYEGPSKTTEDTEIEPIPLNDAELFATEAAMLYDESKGLVLLEGASGVIGSGQVVSYFQTFDQHKNKYSLVRKLDEDAARRARNFQTIRKFTHRVAVSGTHETDHDYGVATSKALARDYDAEIVEITMSVGAERNRALNSGRIRRFLDRFRTSDNENGVTHIKVFGKGHDDEGFADVDMFQQFEVRERTLVIADGRNVPHEDRWDALIEVMEEFRAN